MRASDKIGKNFLSMKISDCTVLLQVCKLIVTVALVSKLLFLELKLLHKSLMGFKCNILHTVHKYMEQLVIIAHCALSEGACLAQRLC